MSSPPPRPRDRDRAFGRMTGSARSSVDFTMAVAPRSERTTPLHPAAVQYVMGVLSELEKKGVEIPGSIFAVGVDIPWDRDFILRRAGNRRTHRGRVTIGIPDEGYRRRASLPRRRELGFVGVNADHGPTLLAKRTKDSPVHRLFRPEYTACPIAAGAIWVVVNQKRGAGLSIPSTPPEKRMRGSAPHCQERFPAVIGVNLRVCGRRSSESGRMPRCVFRRLRQVVTENTGGAGDDASGPAIRVHVTLLRGPNEPARRFRVSWRNFISSLNSLPDTRRSLGPALPGPDSADA